MRRESRRGPFGGSDDARRSLLNRGRKLIPKRRYLRYGNGGNGEWYLPQNPRLRMASIRLYAPLVLGGRARKLAMGLGLLGRPAAPHGFDVDYLERVVAQELGLGGVALALYVSRLGPLEKAAFLALDRAGKPTAFGRAARRAEAVRSLEREHRRLLELESNADLSGHVPRVLAWRDTPAGRVLLTTLAPGRPASRQIGRPHIDFLRALQRPFAVRARFGDSALLAHVAEFLSATPAEAKPSWERRIRDAFEALHERASHAELTLALSQGDFVPWNMRAGKNGLFVFDWEHSEHGYPNWFDLAHFEFMCQVSMRAQPGAREARRWMSRIAAVEGSASLDPGDALMAYLLDVAVRRLRANVMVGRSLHDRELDAISHLVDVHAEWA